MRVVNRIVRFILADASSEAARLVAEGAEQALVDEELAQAFGDSLLTLSASSYLLRLSGSDVDSAADRRDAHSIRSQPGQLSAVLLRNFSSVLSQFPALSAIASPASVGESLAAIDALRVARLPSASQLDFAVMSALELACTAPGGNSDLTLLPSLLHASFAARPVLGRAAAAVELLRNIAPSTAVATASGTAGSPAIAASTASGHWRQLRV